MKKGFFSKLVLINRKKFWSSFSVVALFCFALFFTWLTSISGEGDPPPTTYTVTFYNNDLSGSDGDALAQMVDIYVFKGSNAPDSPFNGSGGLATGVAKLTVTDHRLSTTVTSDQALTIYTNPTDAYNQSNYTVQNANTELQPLTENNPKKYGLGAITSSTNIFIRGLAKNTYSIIFGCGDSYALEDRIDLYESDGTTLISNWSNIKMTHGDDKTFVLKPKTGYRLNEAIVKLNGDNFTPSVQNKDQLTLALTNVNSNKVFTISNVKFKMYNIYFKDGDGNSIPTSNAEVKNETTGNPINENYQLTWQSSVSFCVNLQVGYDRSTVTVQVNGQELTKNSEGYYRFTLSGDAQYAQAAEANGVTITINGIVLNKYSSNFVFEDGSQGSSVKAYYKEYDANNQQTGSTKELVLSTTPINENLLITHGCDFRFYIQIADVSKYKFNYDGPTNQNVAYSEHTDLSNIINTAAIINKVSGITYNVNDSKTQVDITLQSVKDDVGISVKSLKEVNYTINFSAPGDAASHIKIYKGQLRKLSNSTGSFIQGGQVFGSGYDGSPVSAIKSESFCFVVNLIDTVISTGPNGVDSTISQGSGTISTPSYTVYSDQDSSVVKVFEVKDVTPDGNNSITISLDGFHFSKQNVTFQIGNGANPTATVKNYADDSPITNDNQPLKVTYGSSLKFRIDAMEGYYIDDIEKQVHVLDGNNEVSFEYASYSDHADVTINNIRTNLIVSINLDTEEMPITFNSTEGFQYYTVTPNDGGTITSINDEVIRGIVTSSYGSDYCFAVKTETGYDLSSVVLKRNQADLQEVPTIDSHYRIFKISSIKSSINITGSISKTKYTVYFNGTSSVNGSDSTGSLNYDSTVTYIQDGAAIVGNTLTVQHGGSASFQIRLEEQCNQSDLKVYSYNLDSEGNKDMSTKRELPSVSGTYSVLDVTQNMKVEVENLTFNHYVINFVGTNSAYYVVDDVPEGKLTSGTRTVTFGGSYEFGVAANPGYVIGESMAVNCKTASGVTKSLSLNSTSGKYKIANIKENCTITIENVDNIVYNVNLLPVDGVTYYNDTGAVISGGLKIKYGQNFEFSVGIGDAYDDSIVGMYIIVNDGLSSNVSAQKLSSGRYIIPNVTEDINIKVGNISKNKYIVTLTKIEGIDYYNSSGKIITGDNEVEYKDSLLFTVRLYPAYSDSSITVMLGNNKMTSDSEGVYTIPGIDENKTVTVLGVETNKEVELINKINNLPPSIKDISDVSLVIEATKMYNSLSEEKKKSVTNIAILEKLQQEASSIHHSNNDITVQNIDWYIKLVAVPISSDAEACARIYGKLGSEYILSLYNIYLWDTLNDERYDLPKDQTVALTIPTPDMTYFENPTGIHENSDGKLDYLSLTFKGNTTMFETGSFSPMGIIAKRSSTPGRSSLLDAVDANVEAIKDFALTNSNSGSSKNDNSTSTSTNNNSESNTSGGSENAPQGNVSETFKSRNNVVTVEGSALRLILVLMIIILITISIWFIFKNRKHRKEKGKS